MKLQVSILLVLAITSLVSLAESKRNHLVLTNEHLHAAFDPYCQPRTTGDAMTCEDALPYVNSAIKKYKLRTVGQIAGYLSTMAYDSAYLKHDHSPQDSSQGTRSILSAASLRIFVDANPSIQELFPDYPDIDNSTIVDVLIDNENDFEPGAWWVRHGPGCAEVVGRLNKKTDEGFLKWEQGCIFGDKETVDSRLKVWQQVLKGLTTMSCGGNNKAPRQEPEKGFFSS